MENILFYLTLFIIYSILGWIIETANCTFYKKELVLNRGFLIGPYLPVYGVTSIVMILFLNEYKHDLFTLFAMSVVYASIVEYIASYLMEKLFKARWWDYSERKFNLEGRICLRNSLLFGICGVLLVKYIHPFVITIIDMIPNNIFNIISFLLIVIFLIDLIISFIIISNLKVNFTNIRTDSTEEIDKLVKEVLSKNFNLKRRIFKAFPKLRFSNDDSGKILESIKIRLNDIDKGMLDKKTKIRELKINIKNLKKNNESTRLIEEEKQELKRVRRTKI